MDAAMAHRERKQLNFSTIVDFSLSKQGIFFVTLTQKAVAKILPQLFLFAVSHKTGKGDDRFSKRVL